MNVVYRYFVRHKQPECTDVSGPLDAKEYYTGCYIMYFLCDGALLLTISQDIVLSKEKPFYLCLITHDDREHECPF